MDCRRLALIWVLVLSAGCREVQRAPETAGAAGSTASAEPVPPRVYSEHGSTEGGATPSATAPPAVAALDLRVAEQVSHTLKTDPLLESISGNIQTTVRDGVVTLRGGVPSEHALYEIRQRLARLPGVDRINNCLEVELR